MPGMNAYQNLGKAFKTAGETGIAARKKGIQLQGSNLLQQERDRQRSNLFNTLYQAIGLGVNVYDIYSKNADIISYAEKAGYKTESDWLTNFLGSPTFSKEGESYTAAEVYARKFYGQDKQKEEYKIPKIKTEYLLPIHDPDEYLKGSR